MNVLLDLILIGKLFLLFNNLYVKIQLSKESSPAHPLLPPAPVPVPMARPHPNPVDLLIRKFWQPLDFLSNMPKKDFGKQRPASDLE